MEAMFYSKENSKVRCYLCPWRCKISSGKRGVCGVRENYNGTLTSLIYGKASSVHPDPIEKKPLYHFYPKSHVLSYGTVGCNFKCKHCQNWTISQCKFEDIRLTEISPEKAVEMIPEYGCQGIAWTYNEPTIWFEYTYDTAKIAKKDDFYTVYVTNGYICLDPLKKIAPILDAANVDIKGFSDKFYKAVAGIPRWEEVLNATKFMFENNIHVEITNLVIPGHNDSVEDFKKLIEWILKELSEEVPLHISRFHPQYKMNKIPPTPVKTLETLREKAIEMGMSYVYLGNVPGHPGDNTYCPNCENLLMERYGFSIKKDNIEDRACKFCGREINIVT